MRYCNQESEARSQKPEIRSQKNFMSELERTGEKIVENSIDSSEPNKKSGKKEKKKLRFYESWTFLILVCIVFPLVFRALIYSPFHIPSGSMKPSLLIGDFIFVSKSSYGYSRYSFAIPLLAPRGIGMFEGRKFSEQPKRGDVIVFRPPPTPHIDYIKRLVGLPGDRIQMKNGELYINGDKVERKRVEDFTDTDEDGNTRIIRHYKETLPNGVTYSVLDDELDGEWDNTEVYKVPEGHYFLMGDNRDNSADSRTPAVGFVPAENLVGRADVVFISTEDNLWKFWKWPWTMRGERFWTDIDYMF